MSGQNLTFLLRTLHVLLFGLCSLRLLAQTPAIDEAPQPAFANETAVAPQSPRLLANSTVKLGVGDLIELSVFGVPDLATKTRISGSPETSIFP